MHAPYIGWRRGSYGAAVRFVVLTICAIFACSSLDAQAAKPWPPAHSIALTSSFACELKDGAFVLAVQPEEGKSKVRRYDAGKLKKFERKLKRLKLEQVKEGRSDSLRKEIKAARKLIRNIERCGALNPVCSLAPLAGATIASVAGSTRTLDLRVGAECAAEISYELLEAPLQGVLSGSLPYPQFTAPSASHSGNTVRYRACAYVPTVQVQYCSGEIEIQLTQCEVSATTSAVAVEEHSDSSFVLQGASDCPGALQFQLATPPTNGTLTIGPGGESAYSIGFFLGVDTFSYRACNSEGAGCSPAQSVAVTVQAAPSFSGDAASLAPYRDHISSVERVHLVRKLTWNSLRLLEEGGAALSLSEFLEQRLLNLDYMASDLKKELESVRDFGFLFNVPNNPDEYITIPNPSPPAPGQLTELFLPGEEFPSAETQRQGLNRYLSVANRAYHPTLFKYYWAHTLSSQHLLLKSRYSSPAQALMSHLWFGHFGAASSKITGHKEHHVGHYVTTVEREALGNFRRMMMGDGPNGCRSEGAPGIICDAYVNYYLDNHLNTKTAPNENMARELFELFLTAPTDYITGLHNYTDVDDVKASTAFLSGYKLYPTANDELVYDPARHDPDPQSAFSTLAGLYPNLYLENANLTPRQFVDFVMTHHPGVSRFIAGKLLGMLVYPDPPAALVEDAAQLLQQLDYDLSEFIRAIASSEAMFSPAAAERRCYSEPQRLLGTLVNGLSLPLIFHRGSPAAARNKALQMNEALSASVTAAGEFVHYYPTVFSYDYCGRSPGSSKDGSSVWLLPGNLLGRITGVIRFLERLEDGLAEDFSLKHIRQTILGFPQSQFVDFTASVVTDEMVLDYFAAVFNVQLAAEERAKLKEYLHFKMDGTGQLQYVGWNAANEALVEEKFAGLSAIFSSLPTANFH